MSEEHSPPVTCTSATKRPACGETISPEISQGGQGIRLSPVRAGLSWQFMDLPPGHYTLGSRADADIVIDVPGVVERHCTLIVGTQRNVIKAWTNRTWINDGAVSEGTLRPGDRLILGPIELKITALSKAYRPVGISPPTDRDVPQKRATSVLSETDLEQLLASPSIPEDPPTASSRMAKHSAGENETHLQELRQEIDDTLQEVLRKEHENREAFARERLQLSHRAQELTAQWQEIERIRARLLKQEEALKSTADAAGRLERERRDILEQSSLLTDRHEELASRARSLVETHRRLKLRERELDQKLATLSDSATSSRIASVRSLLARNEAQSRQLTQRQKDLEQREEAAHQLSAELTDSRSQLQEQIRQLESEQRQWLGKLKNRERFLDDFEFSLTLRTQEVTEEELRQQSRSHELRQQEQELERRIQEIQLQQQGVDQATRLLEQQQGQFASDDAVLAERKQQLESRQAAIEAAERQLQRDRDSFTRERDELKRRAEELEHQRNEFALRMNTHQKERAGLTQQQAEHDNLRQELEAEREQLQIAQSEFSAEQQNLQRLRNELDAERERDAYDREQLSQSRMLLEQQRQEIEQQRRELSETREELEHQQAELTFQLSEKTSSDSENTERSEDAGQLHQARCEMDAERQQIEIQRQQFVEGQAQLQSDRTSLLEERDALERRQNQVESAREQLSLEQQQLESLRNDIDQSRRELVSDQAELAEIRRRLHDEKEELNAQWNALEQQRDEWHRQIEERQVDGSTAINATPDPEDLQNIPHESSPVQTDGSDSSPIVEAGDSEGNAALQLRQQLASLFGMSTSSPETDPSSSSPAGREASCEQAHTPASEERFGHPATRDDIPAARFSEEEGKAASSAGSQPVESEENSVVKPSAESNTGEDDSIAAYMERLLARTRRASHSTGPVESQPVPPPPRPEPTFRQEPAPAEIEEEPSPAAARKVRKMDEDQKKSIRSDLHSFREVANQSARTAVAKSHRTRKSTSLRYMIALNVAGWILAFGLFIAERWLSFSMGSDAFLLAGISFCLTLLCLYRYKEIRKLSMGNPSAESDRPMTRTGTSGPDTDETPEDKSSPLSFL